MTSIQIELPTSDRDRFDNKIREMRAGLSISKIPVNNSMQPPIKHPFFSLNTYTSSCMFGELDFQYVYLIG